MDSYRTVISLGTNMGDRLQHLKTAVKKFGESAGRVIQISSVYETEAWGIQGQQAFYNQVMLCSTTLLPRELLNALLDIEMEMGRIREVKWGPRLIDLDILYYENRIINEPGLQIPHPFISQRRFILVPLAETAPEWKHPVSGLTAEELLPLCDDKLEVWKLN